MCLIRGARSVVAKMYPEVYIAADKSIVTLNVHVKTKKEHKFCINYAVMIYFIF